MLKNKERIATSITRLARHSVDLSIDRLAIEGHKCGKTRSLEIVRLLFLTVHLYRI